MQIHLLQFLWVARNKQWNNSHHFQMDLVLRPLWRFATPAANRTLPLASCCSTALWISLTLLSTGSEAPSEGRLGRYSFSMAAISSRRHLVVHWLAHLETHQSSVISGYRNPAPNWLIDSSHVAKILPLTIQCQFDIQNQTFTHFK